MVTADLLLITKGEHEYTHYGFRQLLERKCWDCRNAAVLALGRGVVVLLEGVLGDSVRMLSRMANQMGNQMANQEA